MPSRRSAIAMSDAEVRDYLRRESRIILVSNGPNGYPHPMPMNFLVDDEDRIVMTTFRKSQKVLNLRRDPRCALLVESGEDYAELASVLAYADAEIVDDTDVTAAVMSALAEQEAARGHRTLDAAARAQAAPRRRSA